MFSALDYLLVGLDCGGVFGLNGDRVVVLSAYICTVFHFIFVYLASVDFALAAGYESNCCNFLKSRKPCFMH